MDSCVSFLGQKSNATLKTVNISAWLWITASNVHRWASYVKSTIYEWKYDWGTFQWGSSIGLNNWVSNHVQLSMYQKRKVQKYDWQTFYRGGSIGLNNWVLNNVHVNVLEGYFGYKTWATLPCFDLNTISRVFDDWVPHCEKSEIQAQDLSVPRLPMLHR